MSAPSLADRLHLRPMTSLIGKVLFFRDQALTDDQRLALGRALGPLTPAHPIARGGPEHPEIWERHVTVADELPQGPDGFRSRPPEGALFEAIG